MVNKTIAVILGLFLTVWLPGSGKFRAKEKKDFTASTTTSIYFQFLVTFTISRMHSQMVKRK